MRKTIMTKSSPTGIFRASSANNTVTARKSFLGMSGFAFPNGSSQTSHEIQVGHKPVISLPTPNETSREKLKSKLRASSSLMSLTQTDVYGSSLTVAVPIEQHNLHQMEKLMAMCSTQEILNFNSFYKMQAQNGPIKKMSSSNVSEVFVQKSKNGQVENSKVFKIIPFGSEEMSQAQIQEIIQELSIARIVKGMVGFMSILHVAVVKGSYPEELLRQWDVYETSKTMKKKGQTESVRPDGYREDQLYCIITEADAGVDLEKYDLESWTDAESIFWQTVVALAEAEERHQFEHRDLHWGNIVISDKPVELNSDDMVKMAQSDENANAGRNIMTEIRGLLQSRSTLKITLIDYTLSRATGAEGTVHTRMDHPEFYRGKGDTQFEVYRLMRSAILAQNSWESNSLTPSTASSATFTNSAPSTPKLQETSDWAAFCPRTNVLWLHYLVDKLINHKDLQPVSTTKTGKVVSRPGETETHLWAEEARAFRALEMVKRAIEPAERKKVGLELNGAYDLLDWGIRSRTFPAYTNIC